MNSPEEKKRIESLRVAESWAEIPGYVCRACGHPARRHPEANNIWGCLHCGFTTYSVFVYFRVV